MNTTDNFNLKVYEGTDLFNPLTVENANTEAIDEQLYNNEVHGIQPATELLSGTVHAITRTVPDASVFKFTAVSRFTAGDTFTVDGTQVSALTTSGEQLPDGAFVIGSEVIGSLKGTLITFFISAGRVATAQDSEKLGGELPEYYATAEDCTAAQNTATAAGTLAGQNQTAINTLSENLAKLQMVKLWENPNPSSNFGNDTITLNQSDENFDYIKLFYRYKPSHPSFWCEEFLVGNTTGLVRTADAQGDYPSIFTRGITRNSGTSYTFSYCEQQKTNSTSVTFNLSNVLIPIAIYGCKFA